jgi:hypothetical protein
VAKNARRICTKHEDEYPARGAFDCPGTSEGETAEERLTMSNAIVIIKQFCELSLACLCNGTSSDMQLALTAGAGNIFG